MKKENKYQYWTFVTKVGEDYKNRIKIGDHISSNYKKESWEIISNTGTISFMCCGIYNCRTLTKDSNEEKNKALETGINKNAEILKFKLNNPNYFKDKEELKSAVEGKK